MNLPTFASAMGVFRKLMIIFCAAMFLVSCTSRSEQLEQQAIECWGKGWSHSDPTGESFWKGIDSLDQYLLAHGYLGKGMPADYVRFTEDTTPIVIPTDAPGYTTMQHSLYGEFAGAPDVSMIAGCINENLYDHRNELDSTDIIYRFATLFKVMGDAGAPDANFFHDFYSGLTKEEMDRPLIKTMFYFVRSPNGKNRLVIHEPQ